jgi:hypothetical protein
LDRLEVELPLPLPPPAPPSQRVRCLGLVDATLCGRRRGLTMVLNDGLRWQFGV